MFKMMKVFDCQSMPGAVRLAFFESLERGNDCYVSWEAYDDSEEFEQTENQHEVNQWLLANGAENEETVIISHWW